MDWADASAGEEDDDPSTPTGSPPSGRADSWRAIGLYPWLVMGVVLVGSYATVINLTVLGVALPQIADQLAGPGTPAMDWVITTYLIGVVMTTPAIGWFADRFGRRPVYIISSALFGVGSAICTVAPDLWILIAGRLLQGFGAGAIMPLGIAMIYEVFPASRRGTALGVWGVMIMGAPAIGPLVGGWVVTVASWRWIFFAMIPITIIAIAMAVWLLPAGSPHHRHRFDWEGWAFASVGFPAIVVVARNASEWGFTSLVTLVTAGLGASALVIMVVRGLRRTHPLVEFRAFASSTFTLSMMVMWVATVLDFARWNFLPVELQVIRTMTAQEAGLLLVPAAIGTALAMPLGGWLSDRIGARTPVVFGLGILAATAFELARLTPTTSVRWIMWVLVAQGMGAGLAMAPAMVTGMNALPGHLVAQASGLASLNRMLAAAVGTAALAAVIASSLGGIVPDTQAPSALADAQAAYNRVFAIMAACLAVSAVLALLLPGRRGTHELIAKRSEE